jgi:EAL domain-containing protein (putative c-di-GMP-specific phosphodiesterase class I)
LTNLRNFGVDISLDDFGTGYSSFTYLAKLPITTLKIDKSLLDQLDDVEAENSFLLLESLLLMSGKLNYRVVAEGVERSEQLRWLRKMNCHYCQGFLLGRPIPEEEVLAMVMNSPNITKCSWGS